MYIYDKSKKVYAEDNTIPLCIQTVAIVETNLIEEKKL
jgi:hypothetical protein